MSRFVSSICFVLAYSIVSFASLSGCGKRSGGGDEPGAVIPSNDVEPAKAEPVQKADAWFLTKANQSLRLGQPLKDVDTLKDLSVRDAAMKLMDDKAFYDTIMDFSMFWFGAKTERLLKQEVVCTPENGCEYPTDSQGNVLLALSMEAENSYSALYATRKLYEGDNYFDALFSERGQMPIFRYSRPRFFDMQTMESTQGLPVEEARKFVLEKIKSRHLALIQLGEAVTKKDICYMTENVSVSLDSVAPAINFANSADAAGFDLALWCFASQNADTTFGKALFDNYASLVAIDAGTAPQLARLDPGPKAKHVHHIVDLAVPDYSKLSSQSEISTQLWNQDFFSKLQNSSTNRNRKRASWVLKRLFCDDLTPVNVEAPTVTHADQHGTDTACYSCHYKLDPMAGYFREIGVSGISFKGQNTIVFDDLASQTRESYEMPWKAPSASNRPWNIGFVRSPADESQNVYGVDFSDLLGLLKKSPEVKECFVRRVFEYVIGGEQTFDRTWAQDIASRMAKAEASDPQGAIKGVFADVVTSRAFLSRERNNNLCYDLPAGVVAKNRAPCRIASILERNCNSCHSSTSPLGGLDLSRWQVGSDGKPGFVHVKSGVAQTSATTFSSILDRLESQDPAKRMPLMKAMPAPEREELFLWLKDQQK